MENLQAKYQALLKRIDAVRNKEKLVSLLSGLINFISVGLGAILAIVLLEYIFGFKTSGKIACQPPVDLKRFIFGSFFPIPRFAFTMSHCDNLYSFLAN